VALLWTCSVCLVLRTSELDGVLQVGSHESRVEGTYLFLSPQTNLKDKLAEVSARVSGWNSVPYVSRSQSRQPQWSFPA